MPQTLATLALLCAIGAGATGQLVLELVAALAAVVAWRLVASASPKPPSRTRSRVTRAVLLGCGIVVAAVAGVVAGGGVPTGPVVSAVLLAQVGATALCEECLFRGLLLDAARDRVASPVAAVLLVSVAFAVLHLGTPALAASAGGVDAVRFAQLVAKLLEGVAFSVACVALRDATSSIVPCVVVHALYDLVVFSYAGLPQGTYATGDARDLVACVARVSTLVVCLLVARAYSSSKAPV